MLMTAPSLKSESMILFFKGYNYSTSNWFLSKEAVWTDQFQVRIILDATSEKVPSGMRKNERIHIILRMRKVTSGLCSPLIHSVVTNDFGSG